MIDKLPALNDLVKWSNGLISERAAEAILKALMGEEGKELKLSELPPKAYGFSRFTLEAYSPLAYRNYITACISQREGTKVVQGYLKVEGIGGKERDFFDPFLEKRIEVRGLLGEYLSHWLGGMPLLRASVPESRFKVLGEGSLTLPSDIYEMLRKNPISSENCFNAVTGFIIGAKKRKWREEEILDLLITDLDSVASLRFKGDNMKAFLQDLSSSLGVNLEKEWSEGSEIAIRAFGSLYPYTISLWPPLKFYVPRGKGGGIIRGWVRGEELNSMRRQKALIEGSYRKMKFFKMEPGVRRFGFVGRVSSKEISGGGIRISVACGGHLVNLRVFGSVDRIKEGSTIIGFWPRSWSEENKGILPEDLVAGIEGGDLDIGGLDAFSDYVFIKVLQQVF